MGRGWKGALIDKDNNFKPIRTVKQRIFWTVIAPIHIPLASIAFLGYMTFIGIPRALFPKKTPAGFLGRRRMA